MWKKEDDWFWEGNIQGKLAQHLESQGYTVEVADTLSKSKGIDISAVRNKDEILLIEVKEYPSDVYVDGNKRGLKKKTPPTLQARHWFFEVFYSVVQRKSKYPHSCIGIGRPEHPRYFNLISEDRWALEKLEIKIFIATEKAEVYNI